MLEQTVHGLSDMTNRLEQRFWNHHDKSTAIFIHDRTCLLGNDEIARLNSDVYSMLQQP